MSSGPTRNDDAAGVLFFIAAAVGVFLAFVALLLWFAGQAAALLSGAGWPDSSPADLVGIVRRLVENGGDVADAWPAGAVVGPVWLTWTIFLVFLGVIGFAAVPIVRFALNWRRRREMRIFRLGFASGNEIRRTLSAKAVLNKASNVRPSYKGRKDAEPKDVGFYLGRDIRSQQHIYASVEDVFIVLAPPRQGKDVHFCAPFTIDAPGPCIVTSTRADAFTNTYAMRSKLGRVYVFDPNGMTHWPERLRWSPIRGCENPLIASNRAAAMINGAGLEVEGNAAYFILGATTILRCLLHAAALGDRTIRDVTNWCVQQVNPEPVAILRRAEDAGTAAPGWASTLEATVGGEPGHRSIMFAVATQALGCFADPGVMDACSPGVDDRFDLKEFLAGPNTLYVLGKEKKTGSVAPVVTAMLEDLFDGARKVASRMPGSRLDPPLTVELNEAAHIAPLPNLPGYMGDSGGFSISLHVYLQSLSQARSRWGEHEAMIMWDNAAVRVIMGGAGNVNDLEDISRLIGEAEEKRSTVTRGNAGQSVSTERQKRRVLTADEIRTLPFGRAVVVARAARPVEVKLLPWWKRKDGDQIGAGKAETEKRVLEYTGEAEAHPTAR